MKIVKAKNYIELKADAISVLKGGKIKTLDIRGNLITNGNDVVTFHVNGGNMKELKLDGNIIAN